MKNQRGAVLILVALLLVVLFGMAALAIDVGYIYAARNELQNIADASALGAARRLGSIYGSMSYADQQNFVCDKSVLYAVAREVAMKNQAAGKAIDLLPADVFVGRWSEWKTLPAGTARTDESEPAHRCAGGRPTGHSGQRRGRARFSPRFWGSKRWMSPLPQPRRLPARVPPNRER